MDLWNCVKSTTIKFFSFKSKSVSYKVYYHIYAIIPFSPPFNRTASARSLSNSKFRGRRDEATVTSYLYEKGNGIEHVPRDSPFQLQSGRDSIVISTSRRTTEAFPTPGDTIVPDVARYSTTWDVLSKERKRERDATLSCVANLRSRRPRRFVFASNVQPWRDFFSRKTTRNLSGIGTFPTSRWSVTEVHQSPRKRHKSTFLRVGKINDFFSNGTYRIRKCTVIRRIFTVFCNYLASERQTRC